MIIEILKPDQNKEQMGKTEVLSPEEKERRFREHIKELTLQGKIISAKK